MQIITTLIIILLGSGIYFKLARYIFNLFIFQSIEMYTKFSYAIFVAYILFVIPGLYICSQKLKIEIQKK